MTPPPARQPPTSTLSAEELLRQLLGTEVGALLRFDPIARRTLDPEGIHQLRVGTRRLRSELEALGRTIQPTALRYFQRELRWVARILGQQRDVDVLGEVLEGVNSQLHTSLPVKLWEELTSRDKSASRRVQELLNSTRYRKLVRHLSDAVINPPVRRNAHAPALDFLGPQLDAALRDLFDGAKSSGPTPDSARLHEIRILAKKGRYCAETAVPLLGNPASKLSRELESVQSVLGELHDYAVAIIFLEAHIKTPDVEPGTDEHHAVAVAIEQLIGLIEEMKLQWSAPLERARIFSQLLNDAHEV